MKIKRILNNTKLFLVIKTGILKKINIRPLLGDAQVKIVEGCNSRCVTCDIWKGKTKKEMSTGTYEKVLDELKKAGLKWVGMTGGEPLLHSQIGEMCRITKKEGLILTIATNGLLLSNRIEDIAKYVDYLSISLDGLEKTNDKIRGVKGYYKNAIDSIEYIRKKYPKIKISISTTITDSNFNEVESILKWCKRKGVKWSANLLMNSLYFFKMAKIDDLRVAKTKREILKFKEILQKYEKEKVVNIAPIAIDYLSDFLLGEQKKTPCLLGLVTAYVDTEGNYYSGCWALPPIGNLVKEDMNKIVNGQKFKNRIWNMYKLKCPGCTCGYDQNWKINNYDIHLFRKLRDLLGI